MLWKSNTEDEQLCGISEHFHYLGNLWVFELERSALSMLESELVMKSDLPCHFVTIRQQRISSFSVS